MVVVVVGKGSCSWVYMSVYNTGKGSAGYITIVFSDAETCKNYRICSCNLRTFFSILAAEKSGCVK